MSVSTKAVQDHGGWLIWHDPMPIEWRGADWHYAKKDAREDFDIGHAESRDMCLQSIDYIDEQDAIALSPEGQAKEARMFERSRDNLHKIMLIFTLGRALESAKSVIATGGKGTIDGTHLAIVNSALAEFREYQA